MAHDGERERIEAAAADLLEQHGVALTRMRDVAKHANVSTRALMTVAPDRSALLRQVVADLPFPPNPSKIQDQAEDPHEPPLQALIRAAREAFGHPASSWDPRELQALALARYDDELAETVRQRVGMRWDALGKVLRQLRSEGGVDPLIDDDAAILHALSLTVGLSMLEHVTPKPVGGRAWAALASRLLESLSTQDVPDLPEDLSVRPWRVRVWVDDGPTAVSRLLQAQSLLGARVWTVVAHGQRDEQQMVDLVIDVPSGIGRDSIETALSSVAEHVVVWRGVPDDRADIAARVLDLAAVLAKNPAAAPQAVARVVLADSWEVTEAAEGRDASRYVMRLQWTPDYHVVLTRTEAPFTATERARASALLRLVEALAEARGDARGFGWADRLPGGQTVYTRLARPEDADAVADMHERSSEATRYQRYFAPMNEWREENLRRISGGHRGATLVVTDGAGEVIGLGNVFPEAPDEGVRAAEFATIVEDAWQGRGVGSHLIGHLLVLARRMGFGEVVAYVLADNAGMLRLLERTGLEWRREPAPELGASVVKLSAPLGGDPAA